MFTRLSLIPKFTAKTAGAFACAAGLLFTAACGTGDGDTEPVAAPVEGAHVELKSAGETPRELLEWEFNDEEQHVDYSASQGLEQHTENADSGETIDADDDAEYLPYGDVTMTLPLTANTEATDDDNYIQHIEVGKPGGSNQALNEEMGSAEGFKMTTTLETNGRAIDRTFAAPEDATDGARASIETALTQMTDFPIIFPDEPVGPNAEWTVDSRVDEGISLRQVITYKVIALDGDTVDLDVQVKRRPAVSSLAETDLKVLDAKSTSTGNIKLDLKKPLPTGGDITVDTTVTYGQPDSDLRVIQKSTARNEWDA